MTEQPLRTPVEESAGMPDVWRDEVQARLERYKRRRGRRIEGAFTMRFPFPPDEPVAAVADEEDEAPEIEQPVAVAATELAPAEDVAVSSIAVSPIAVSSVAAASTAAGPSVEAREPIQAEADSPEEVAPPPAPTASVVALAPEPEEEPDRVIELAPRPMPRRKVIAFPAPSYTQNEVARRIADPVQPEQLRILDVPEELQAIQSTPFLEGLLDAPAGAAPSVQRDVLELPCATARGPRRLGAASIDAAVTLGTLAIFAAAASRLVSALPPTKFLIAGIVAAAVLLWATYQYLFLVYRGRTLGMMATGVCLQTFKGRFPDFRRRQLRVVGLYLSVLSLGMGVLWYLVDVDSLCWHDRISQTFPTAADKP
jgi:uncharacterized RDD family membrane protein YckC